MKKSKKQKDQIITIGRVDMKAALIAMGKQPSTKKKNISVNKKKFS